MIVPVGDVRKRRPRKVKWHAQGEEAGKQWGSAQLCALGVLSAGRGIAPAWLPSRVTEKIKGNSGQEPLPAGMSPGNVRNAVFKNPAAESTISGNIRVLRAPMRAERLKVPCTYHPGMLLVLATTQQVTSSWAILPHSRADSASSSRAHVGQSVE